VTFEFATATRIVFGAGKAGEAAAAARSMGRRPLLVGSPRWWHLLPGEVVRLESRGEPTVDVARAGAALARQEGCDVVVAIGGGSAIDTGKAIAALAANPGDVLDYLEVIGAGKPIEHRPLPFIAVPTTSGTGAEVTRNAVLGSPGDGVKASLRSPLMLPALAIVDPELTRSLPREVAAYTGMDALTQLIEPLVSVRANTMSDMAARQGLALAVPAIRTLDPEAMAQASLLSGMALANSGLGAVHGFAAAIGGMFSQAPHGAICAALLAPVMRANIEALRTRDPEGPALRKYAEAPPPSWVEETMRLLGVKPLIYYGVDLVRADDIVLRAIQTSSLKGNPIALSAQELKTALLAGG
jgi:alcohol dehydrogenase class IV